MPLLVFLIFFKILVLILIELFLIKNVYQIKPYKPN